MTDGRREAAAAAWERATAWPFVALSFVFLVAYSVRIIAHDELPDGWKAALSIVLTGIWAVFLVDYVGRFVLARRKWRFVKRHVPDLLSVLVPLFRPFRLVRALRRVPLFASSTGDAVRGRIVVIGLAFVVLYVYTLALGVLQAERGAPGATIETLGEAVWWACVTIATVGYGDYAPVTDIGRMLAVLLMVGGVAIIGTASATIVSAINDHVHREAHERHERREHERSEHERDEPDRSRDASAAPGGPGNLDG